MRFLCAVSLVLSYVYAAMAPLPVQGASVGREVLPTWFKDVAPWVAPEVQQQLASGADEPLRIIVILKRGMASPPTSRAAQVRTLRGTYERDIASLRPLLDEAASNGALLARRDLWIIHGIALTAKPSLVRRLIASPMVAEVRLDHLRQYLPSPPTPDFAGGQVTPWGKEVSATETELPWGVARVRAPETWTTLGISGTGAVVALFDTGTSYVHPEVAANYRGNLGHGLYDHAGSWFDAVRGGVYPYDDHGHGTHVAGTAVGQTVGVAPGAKWIAVKGLSGEGKGYDSWLHAGFQWLLAPNGDPSLAPDVVNCSWGNDNGYLTTFQEDVAQLMAAGILPIFAVGNNGMSAYTVGSPASLRGVFSVGASDPYDEIAFFSSRGPSPWGEVKPAIVAPGIQVRSAVPGGIYYDADGTSMATPHVVGVAALLRGVSPTLAVPRMTAFLTTTARPLSSTIPNNESGWGLVDAFASVVSLTHPAIFTGAVSAADGTRLAGAHVQATPLLPTGRPGETRTTVNGVYTLALTTGTYNVTAAAFGYQSLTRRRISATAHSVQRLDFTLTPLPRFAVQGRVSVRGSAAPPTRPVTVRVLGTPLSTSLTTDGRYALTVPSGRYTLEVRGNGYRVVTASLVVTDAPQERDFILTPAPTLLLVDAGAWYYHSQSETWGRELDGLRYAYDVARLKQRYGQVPSLTTLLSYDQVLWASPLGSPGVVDAGEVLSGYLRQGGRLFLSGQNVAYYDWGLPYLRTLLGVGLDADDAGAWHLRGEGFYHGITLTLNGGDGADDQTSPDAVRVISPWLASRLWTYDNGQGGGVAASVCVTYRAAFFSFGYEGIGEAATRREVLSRTLTWLAQPAPRIGATFYRRTPARLIDAAGTTVTHTLYLRHTGVTGQAETFALALSAHRWATALTPSVVTLAPCRSVTVTVAVTIPPDVPRYAEDVLTLTARSLNSAATTAITLATQSPAPVLLVDDDRWFAMEGYYRVALQREHVLFDVWDTSPTEYHPMGASPPITTLLQYPVVVWFTAYDWYEPISLREEAALSAYLDAGGRLLLSSQDFLDLHEEHPLQERLGVMTVTYENEVTGVFGVADHPAGGMWGPVTLDYPFHNWADSVEPFPDAVPVVRNQTGQPVAVTGRATITRGRSLFYAFPLESLPLSTRAEVLGRGVGWLSPLGRSEWRITPTAPIPAGGTVLLPGMLVTQQVVLRNDAPHPLTVNFTAPVASSFRLLPEMCRPPLSCSAAAITWRGSVSPSAPLTFSWGVTVAAPGGLVTPELRLDLPDLRLGFTRTQYVRIAGGDLGHSHWLTFPSVLTAGELYTVAFLLRNDGPGIITDGAASLWLMPGLAITATQVPMQGTGIRWWRGAVAPGETHRLTLTLRPRAWQTPQRVDVLLGDGAGRRYESRTWVTVEPRRMFLPLLLRQ